MNKVSLYMTDFILLIVLKICINYIYFVLFNPY